MSIRSFLFLKIIAVIMMITGALVVPGSVVFSQGTSTNFDLRQEHSGFTEFQGTSTNYEFRATIGEGVVGNTSSTNFSLDQGKTWISGEPTVTITYAVPQLRVTSAGVNDDVTFYITVRTADNSDNVVLFTSDLATSNADGTYSIPIPLTGIAPGIYDIGIKTDQHLTKVLQDVVITSSNTPLNFSDTDYAAVAKGSEVLLAGDINGAGTDPATLGDDVVNSVDLSILLPDLDLDDLTGNANRANLNQDVVVNSVDLSIMLDNLDKEGDI